MNQVFILVFLFLFLAAGLSAQTVTGAVGDAFGNVYAVENRTEIVRLDSSGRETARQSLPGNAGFIDRISVGAALGPAVFGSGNREIVLLDRFLAEESRFNFDHSEAQMPAAAVLASDNSFWVSDRADLNLKKIGVGGQTLLKIDLQLFTENEGFDLTGLQESNGNVALAEGDEVTVWDRFGNLKSRFPAGRQFVLVDDRIGFVRAGRLAIHSVSGRQISLSELPEECSRADCMAAGAGLFWFFIGNKRLKVRPIK